MADIRKDFERFNVLTEARVYCRKRHISFGVLMTRCLSDLERDPDMTANLLWVLRQLKRAPKVTTIAEPRLADIIVCTPTHAAITHDLLD